MPNKVSLLSRRLVNERIAEHAQTYLFTASKEGTGKIWRPLRGPQSHAYHSPADELYYGGAAGGGKTDLAIGLSLTEHTRTIFFRREYPQLYDVRLRYIELLSGYGKVVSHEAKFGNRLIEFGAVQYEKDKMKYQGRAHDLIVFDEASHFLESQVSYLKGWNRTTIPNQRCRILYTGNPPALVDGFWILQYWAPWINVKDPQFPFSPGKLKWYINVDNEYIEVENSDPVEHKDENGKEIILYPKSRTFIPANIKDNPYLAGSGYEANLQNLPEPLRSQLLYGDHTITQEDDPWQVIPTAWVVRAMDRWTKLRPKRVVNEETGETEVIPLSSLGVDVARGGEDQTIIVKRYGNWFAPLIKYPGQSTPNGQLVAAQIMKHHEAGASINIDVIGIGASVYDILSENRVHLTPVNGAERSDGYDRSGKLKFANKRAEVWWKMRESLDPEHGENIMLPDDQELLADLTSPRWDLKTSGIMIEGKEQIKKRLGRSPDCGDAICYANYSKRWGFDI